MKSVPSVPTHSHWYATAMEKLVEVVQNLSRAVDLDSVVDIVRRAARDLTGADGATFILRDGDLCFYVDEDAISPLWKGKRFPMRNCISGWAMMHRRHVAITDIFDDRRIPADLYRQTFVKSLLVVPVRQDDPIGAIGNYWSTPHTPSDEEIKVLQALANATSISLRNIELMRRAETTYAMREQAILDNILDGVITADASGTIETFNRAAEQMFGYDAVEVIGQHISMIIPNDFDVDNLSSRLAYLMEMQGRHRSGRTFPTEVAATRIDIAGRTLLSGIIRDISDRKAHQRKLEDAKTVAEKATQAKSDFLAIMSHELRTPLNSIIGMTRLLHEDTSLGREHRDMSGIAYKSAGRLLSIVNDILDLSKVEAGELKLEKTVFSLHDAVEGIMQTMIPLSSQKRITFAYALDDLKDPVYYISDPLRIGRIIINLVGNAIKYTETGGVKVEARLYPYDGDANMRMLEFSVTDTGIGIPASKIGHIFDQFAQADTSITRRFGGTGLGLHIAKLLVEKMDGAIGVESTEGVGSRFWFTLPLEVSVDEPSVHHRHAARQHINRLPPEQRKPIAEARILIAEDHALNQQYMHYLLRRMGVSNYDIVNNGREALDSVAAKTYDMVLMDCHMPEVSGYDATREIRRHETAGAKRLPIVAMTADAMVGTREFCLQNGMDDYISKPLNPDELQNIMSRWVDFPDTTTAPSSSPAPSAESTTPSMIGFTTNLVDHKKLIDIFVNQWEQTLILMRRDCVDGENTEWTEAAHKLKGSAALCRAQTLQDLCNTAQYMKTATADERRDILDLIEHEYASVRDILLKTVAPA